MENITVKNYIVTNICELVDALDSMEYYKVIVLVKTDEMVEQLVENLQKVHFIVCSMTKIEQTSRIFVTSNVVKIDEILFDDDDEENFNLDEPIIFFEFI